MSDRVLVAMSGGVDSSVAAAFLARRGYQVLGVTLKLWDGSGDPDQETCGGKAAVDSARAVADRLSVEHMVVDGSAGFSELVLRPAWEDYAGGLTPNPCLRCNRVIKFATLCRQADELGARWIATGHHARLERSPGAVAPGVPRLRRGADRRKDQSYFLAMLTGDQLGRSIFPVGDLTKAEVRQIAREMGLPSAERAESQDACFTGGQGGFAEALRLHFRAPERPGIFVDPAGTALGTHRGVHHFTVGQRKGLGISLGRRAYVSAIRAQSGEVVVTDAREDLLSGALTAGGIRWALQPPRSPFSCQVQIRYRSPAVEATVLPAQLPAQLRDGSGDLVPDDTGDLVRVVFSAPQHAVTPGQGVVFYDNDLVLGGGWIREAHRDVPWPTAST